MSALENEAGKRVLELGEEEEGTLVILGQVGLPEKQYSSANAHVRTHGINSLQTEMVRKIGTLWGNSYWTFHQILRTVPGLQNSWSPWGTLPFITLARDAGPTEPAGLRTSRYQ